MYYIYKISNTSEKCFELGVNAKSNPQKFEVKYLKSGTR